MQKIVNVTLIFLTLALMFVDYLPNGSVQENGFGAQGEVSRAGSRQVLAVRATGRNGGREYEIKIYTTHCRLYKSY